MSVWSEAQQKQKDRRGQSAGNAGFAGTLLAKLTQVGAQFHVQDVKGNNTTAVGLAALATTDPQLYVAIKGYAQPNRDQLFLAAQTAGLPVERAADVFLLGNDEYLHSEMAIVQAAAGGQKDVLTNQEFFLEIACIGKGVCPDCSGFLSKYRIPHTSARDNAAANWMHPFTGAVFSGTGGNLSYMKSTKYIGSATASNVNPRARTG